MSHITKDMLQVIMTRMQSKIRCKIPKEQGGFVEDSGKVNAIFMLRMLEERAVEVKRDLYVCFLDYTKAFDKVRHGEMLEMLQNLDTDDKDIKTNLELMLGTNYCN